MKRYLLFLGLSLTFTLQAQAPQGFNYQATVRNSAGDLIVNTNVYFKFNVMQGSQTSLPVFTEIHYVPTDDLGQVNLVIGQGTATTGAFSSIDWSLGSHYLGIELDTGSGYVAMGTTQLLSVPYALYAENSGNSTPTTPNLQSVLAENNSANNQQIKDLQDPTDAQDAVTKNYAESQFYSQSEVDALIANLQSQIDDIDSNNSSGSVTDQDGNTYDYLTYGDQVWTVENAEMVTYRDGTPIPEVTDNDEWGVLTTGAWCYYDNDPTKGKLYNWYAVMGIHDTDPNTPNKEFAPEGWHVPTEAEWILLKEKLISNGYNFDGSILGNKIAKAIASTTGWINSSHQGVPGNDQNTNNSSGFNAFPVGSRNANNSFDNEGHSAFFWGSTESDINNAFYFGLVKSEMYVVGFNYLKKIGHPVRLVKDSLIDIDNDGDGITQSQGDCDDNSSNVYPGATELEDGIDNNCNGEIDEGFNESSTVTDIDGNTYAYLTYGDQVWTVENAEMVTYRDGTPIPQATDETEWANLTTGAWCYFDNDPSKGKLYNWYAVRGIHDNNEDTPNKEIAPDGWRIPTNNDVELLKTYLIDNGFNYDGTTIGNKIAKAMASTTQWNSATQTGAVGNDQSLNNSSGFNLFPNGSRENNGLFTNEGTYSNIWSFNEFGGLAFKWYLLRSGSELKFSQYSNRRSGFSVRFIKN